jgi:peptidoglycan/xylan/chitin deacetylase (PgdA/CDA1 family)
VRTEVCLTVDVEFSIGGAFQDPVRNRPVGETFVRCPADGADQGLGFILECLRRHRLEATFFVEPLNYFYFGEGPMKGVVQDLLAAGQDVQLHLHPCWLAFRDPKWPERLAEGTPDDSCAGRSVEEMVEIIGLGLEALDRWGAPRPTALRAGNLHADRATYRAMARHGLGLASNLGIGYRLPSDPTLHLAGGRHWVEGVMEVPVLSYTELKAGSWGRKGVLTVTGASFAETCALLRAARRLELSPVVILTHPWEFAKIADPGCRRITRNRINQRRLESLCRFLREHDDEFAAVTFAEAGPGWVEAGKVESPHLEAPLLAVLGRMASNRLNDAIWRI